MPSGGAGGASLTGAGGSGGTCDATVPTIDVPDVKTLDAAHIVVPPSALDPATDMDPQRSHHVFVPNDPNARRPQLFVMLPGTDGSPGNNQNLLRIAATAGFRSVGLAYPSSTNQGDLCGTTADPAACNVAFAEEKLYGVDATPVVDVNEPNSIEGRLRRLLQAAEVQVPGAGFGDYLSNGEIVWEKLVVAGFSQGSGLAGFLGKDKALARNVFFSSGCDVHGTSMADAGADDWCSLPRQTPASKMFGLLHAEDKLWLKSQAYTAYGMDAFGEFADAGTLSPSYCTGTHILTTSLAPAPGGGAHNSLASDTDMPVDADGVPLLAEDYFYLMTEGLAP